MSDPIEAANTPTQRWQDCRIGSCQRHQECMYVPCRAPRITVAAQPRRHRSVVAGAGAGGGTVSEQPPSLLHVWTAAPDGTEYCRQCGKPKSDMDKPWPRCMAVCAINLVRKEWGIVTDGVVT